MAIDFGKYKTYDTGNGYGNPDEWKNFFDEIFKKVFSGEFKTEYEHKSKIKRKRIIKTGYFINCKNEAEIKTEFRKLMMVHHPDIAGEQSTEKCKEIINEYNKVLNK